MSDTILIIDDEQRIIDIARMYLEQDGYTVNQRLMARSVTSRSSRTSRIWWCSI